VAYTQAVKVCGRRAGAAPQQQADAIAAAAAATAAVGAATEQQAPTIAAAEAAAAVTVQQQLLSVLNKLAERLQQQCGDRELANIIWSCSKLNIPATAQLLLPHFLHAGTLQQAKPEEVAKTLWAVVTMGQQVPAQQMQQLLAAFGKQLAAAQPEDISRLLWACGKLHYLPLQLLQCLRQDPQQRQQLLAAAKPQQLADMAWACAQLGCAGQLPEALLQRAALLLQDGATGGFTVRQLCSLCWSAAVLDLQQCVPQVLQLAAAASQLSGSSRALLQRSRNLYQVHLWLLDNQLPKPIPGLMGVLTQQQLEQCRASREQRAVKQNNQLLHDRQKSVFEALLTH
jgi:hypothetical protein